MNKLQSVKLPLKLAQSGGIAKDAFKNNTSVNTIEFDFTTASDKNLSNFDTAADGQDVKTALTNIYKMFAAEGSGFGDITTPIAVDKAWLPTTTTLVPSDFDATKKAYHVDFNGITWSARVAAPENGAFTNTVNEITSKLQGANTLEITGTLPASATGGFKYRYTGYDGQLNSNGNGNQTLPSNVTMIKIVLNKGVAGK